MSTAISDEDRAAFKQKQFYIPALNTFWDDACRSFYESYTGLKGEELENHIIDIVGIDATALKPRTPPARMKQTV